MHGQAQSVFVLFRVYNSLEAPVTIIVYIWRIHYARYAGVLPSLNDAFVRRMLTSGASFHSSFRHNNFGCPRMVIMCFVI